MSALYNLKDYIQDLAIAPRIEGFLEQREITIQSYQTNIPFDYEALNQGIESAWLSPQVRFGVFSRTSPYVTHSKLWPIHGACKDVLSINKFRPKQH